MTASDFFLYAVIEPIWVITLYEVSGWVWRRLFPGKSR